MISRIKAFYIGWVMLSCIAITKTMIFLANKMVEISHRVDEWADGVIDRDAGLRACKTKAIWEEAQKERLANEPARQGK